MTVGFERKIQSKRLEIQSPQQKVWDILFNIEQYPTWNPFTWKVESGMKVGDDISLHVRMPIRGDRMQKEIICVMDEPRQMSWQMKLGFSFLLRARRDQFIEKINDESCSYETIDVFNGLLAPLVYSLFKQDVENGFNALANALKAEAENRVSGN